MSKMIIGISGKLRHGKDAVAARLTEKWGFQAVSFAAALKEEVIERLPRTLAHLHDQVCRIHCGEPRRQDCIREMVYNTKPPGFRELLQEYGTDVRRRDDDDYWCRKWRIEAMKGERVVSADVRFPNEAESVRKVGGYLWRVVRPGVATVSDHPSETALDWYNAWDAAISNDGTLDDLWDKVDRLVQGFGLQRAA